MKKVRSGPAGVLAANAICASATAYADDGHDVWLSYGSTFAGQERA